MISTQCASTRKGNAGDPFLGDFRLKQVDRKCNNVFFARLREIHQNNSCSVPE